MARYYPHRQTLIISIVCVLAVIGAFLYSGIGKPQDTASKGNSSDQQDIAISEPTLTIPETGDWRKSFLGEATTSSFTQSNNPNPTEDLEPKTLTGQFGKNFFARFMLLQQNGQTNDENAVKTIVNQSMNELTVSAPLPKIYREKDITISGQIDIVAEKAYANAVGSIFYTDSPHDDATIIASEALTNNDESVLKEIDPIITSYQTMITKLRATPVPKTLVTYHLDLLNGVSALLFMSEGMAKVMSDPAQGLVALSAYEISQNAMHNALLKMNAYLVQRTISFEKNEPGNFFATVQ